MSVVNRRGAIYRYRNFRFVNSAVFADVFRRQKRIAYTVRDDLDFTVRNLFEIQQIFVFGGKFAGVIASVDRYRRIDFGYVRISFALPFGNYGYFHRRRIDSVAVYDDFVIVFYVFDYLNSDFLIKPVCRKVLPFARKGRRKFRRGVKKSIILPQTFYSRIIT